MPGPIKFSMIVEGGLGQRREASQARSRNGA
jgi:hypothetical protein